MIHWYRSVIKASSWCVAENWRFLKSYEYASEELKSMGRILGFQGRQHALVEQTGKFYRTSTEEYTHHDKSRDLICKFTETEWRKNPTHQGGYLLDSGVHYMAGLRQLLASQPGNQIIRVTAFTNLFKEYLPPADTANALLKTKSGITGTFQLSVGTSLRADEWTVACEDGWVKVEDSQVTLCRSGKITQIKVPNERTGVPPKIRAWGEALSDGKVMAEQEPENALAHLELVS